MDMSINVLLQIHTLFSKLPVNFRERVCEECNWSLPTFYRKMRTRDSERDGKIVPALSNAEKKTIVQLMSEVYSQANIEIKELLPE
ncbi:MULTISPECIES: hypothetical protein [unclassified Chitinophaga]|uniref:hypothetical protein n=1 Tax=unclassified Chitinophaga TaxID=2619133 RepID=UPI00300F88A7